MPAVWTPPFGGTYLEIPQNGGHSPQALRLRDHVSVLSHHIVVALVKLPVIPQPRRGFGAERVDWDAAFAASRVGIDGHVVQTNTVGWMLWLGHATVCRYGRLLTRANVCNMVLNGLPHGAG